MKSMLDGLKYNNEDSPILLRSLENDDFDRIYKWHNDVNLYYFLIGPFRYVSQFSVRTWLENKQTFSSENIHLAICLKEDNQHIGNIHLKNIDWISRHSEISIFIAETKHRNKGYGKKSIEMLIKHSFFDLGLNRLYLFVLEENIPAIKTYKKCGFLEEGILKNHVFKKGSYNNVLIMGLNKT